MHRTTCSCSEVHSESHTCHKQRTIIKFSDWHEYVDYCEVQLKLPVNILHLKGQSGSLAQTLKLSRTGDPSGAEKISHYSKVIFDAVSQHLKDVEIVADVTGGSFDIAELLAEIPTCFRHFSEVEDAQAVKIVFSPEVHCDSHLDALFIRGAAMIALIEALEAVGRRVELWMGFDTQTSKGHYESQICIKRQGQTVNITDLVFPCTSQFFLQHLEFSILRSEWGKSVSYDTVGHNSGMSLSGDIVVDGNKQDGKMWASPEKCQVWIMGLLKKLGVEVSE